jgi:type III restriction enzyme
MHLKDYQVRVLDTLSGYLNLLGEEFVNRARILADMEKLPAATRDKILSTLGDPVLEAWKSSQVKGIAASPDPWRSLGDGVGRSIPHICLKLPTGGGKTLLAAHGVDRILVNHFRQTTGFVLWIVPTDAIYQQTKAQLLDRGHPIRQTLDRASGGRVRVLEKLDGFTKQDVEQKLCVLLLMLQSTGRENKESLKVFQESGQFTSFYPQDDPVAQAELLKQVSNLEHSNLVEAMAGQRYSAWIKQSLGNTLRLIRPIIVLDEGHRSYSALARGTLASFNPRFVLELSATPDRIQSNILVNISGRALKEEEMIKLPIRLEIRRKLSWQAALQDAVDRLSELDKQARSFEKTSGRYIRPILLVRVDRTGKEQRDKAGKLVHSEDAFDFLTQKAGIAPEAIRRQTAEVKELKDDDLLSHYCGVRIIITKDALREGWDCPFAYVLAILSKGTARTALTQMVGRILRQPHATRTGIEWLDEAHVFCADVDVGEAVAHIKDGLEVEGMGDLAGEIKVSGSTSLRSEIEIRFRPTFRSKRIMVPRVLHRQGKAKFRDLDYEADVLASVDFAALAYQRAGEFTFADYDIAKRESVAIDFKATNDFDLDMSPLEAGAQVEQNLDQPSLIQRMLDIVPNPWQAARILDVALSELRPRGSEDDIIASRLTLIEHIKDDLRAQIEQAAESVFRRKVQTGEIIFKLLAAPLDELNFEFEELFTTHVSIGDAGAPLLNIGGSPLDKALYDKVFKKSFNDFEKNVALYLDGDDAVTWWWRIAARREWGLQGWMKNKVYPDFLVQLDAQGETARLLVLETKGKHLEGSQDTEFKSKFFKVLEEAYSLGKVAGEVELLTDAPESMRFRIVIQELSWKAELAKSLV